MAIGGTTTSAITSQNGTAPKLSPLHDKDVWGAITSQNGTAPKQQQGLAGQHAVRLPVRTALLQNIRAGMIGDSSVRLPVRTALLQNR